MENNNLVAQTATVIQAPVDKVWDALVNPAVIKQYMFGTVVDSDWKKGSPITWKGEWEGKPYEDKGEILTVIPNEKLQYSHFSPLSGQEDQPGHYHIVTIVLQDKGGQTGITLSQDKNATEAEREKSAKNWAMMLESLKKLLEGTK